MVAGVVLEAGLQRSHGCHRYHCCWQRYPCHCLAQHRHNCIYLFPAESSSPWASGGCQAGMPSSDWNENYTNNNTNTNTNNNNNNNNNLYLKRVTQFNDKDLSWGPLPLACLQVARGPQDYKVVQYIAFRYRDLNEVEMVHIWLLQLSHSKVWALSMKCIFGQLIYFILEELIVRRLHFVYNSRVWHLKFRLGTLKGLLTQVVKIRISDYFT